MINALLLALVTTLAQGAVLAGLRRGGSVLPAHLRTLSSISTDPNSRFLRHLRSGNTVRQGGGSQGG